MHILFVSDYIPYPIISGDRVRIYNLIRRVANHHQVSLAAPVRNEEEARSAEELKKFCLHVETAPLPRRHPLVHLPGLVPFFLTGKPLELKFLYSRELAKSIKKIIDSTPTDLVQFEHSRMGHYREAIPDNGCCRSILSFHNVASYQFDSIYRVMRPSVAKFRAWLFSRQMKSWEPRYAQKFDRCFAVSEKDRDMMVAANSGLQVDVIPNGVDTDLYTPLDRLDQPGLLMLGLMSYAPYADSATYFCEKILPSIKEKIRSVHVFIVGSNPPQRVRDLGGDGVFVTGRVPDVVPYYQQTSISIVPLRAGGGTRLKILESMALGRPVVSTSIGCEGLNVRHNEHLLIADQPDKFAESVVRLLQDTALYDRLADQARELVETQYGWNTIAKKMVIIYDQLVNQSV